MSSEGDNMSIHIGNVSGGNNIIGTNHGGQHNQFGGAVALGPGDVFDAIEHAIPEEEVDELIESVIDPLEALANKPKEEQTEDVQERAHSLVSRLQPHAGVIAKTLVTLGEAGLSALASTNPVIAILVATFRSAKEMLQPKD